MNRYQVNLSDNYNGLFATPSWLFRQSTWAQGMDLEFWDGDTHD